MNGLTANENVKHFETKRFDSVAKSNGNSGKLKMRGLDVTQTVRIIRLHFDHFNVLFHLLDIIFDVGNVGSFLKLANINQSEITNADELN